MAVGLVFAASSARADDPPPLAFAAAGPGEVVILHVEPGQVNPFFSILGAAGAGGRAEVHLLPGAHQFPVVQSGASAGGSSLLQLQSGALLTTGPQIQVDQVGGAFGMGGNSRFLIGSGARWTSLNDAILIDDAEVVVSAGGTLTAQSVQLAVMFPMLWNGLVSVLKVTGDESRLETDGLSIGKFAGPAFVEITGGATAFAREVSTGMLGDVLSGKRGEGTLHVAGAGSLLESTQIIVGDFGIGFLEVENSGRVETDNLILGASLADGILYSSHDGSGAVTVQGQSSSLAVASEARIGHNGSGLVRMHDGARADVGALILGELAAGNGVVEIGSGASLNVTGMVSVGNFGNGTFRLLSRAEAEVDGIFVIGALAGSGGVAEIDNARLLLNEDLYVGYEAEGVLHLEDGAEVTSTRVGIGVLEGSLGAVRVRGALTTWINDERFRVGREDKGTMIIEEGAWVTTHSLTIALQTPGGEAGGKDSRVTVRGIGSGLKVGGELELARQGVGQLYLSDGAQVEAGDLIAGTEAESFGHVDLLGDNTRMETGTAEFGRDGHAQMLIKSGAGFTVVHDLALGTEEDGIGIIEVEHATLEVNGTLRLGVAGGGRILLREQGILLTADAHVPDGAGIGRLYIEGAESVWFSSGRLFLGHDGPGEFRVSADAAAVVHSMSIGPNGTVEAPALHIGSAANLAAQAAGALQLMNSLTGSGAAIQVESLDLHPGAILDVAEIEMAAGGELGGAGSVPGNLTNRGRLRPGSEKSSGVLAVAGDYVQETEATLEIHIGSEADYSSLAVGGTAVLGGTLLIVLADGFVPDEGSRFEILQAEQFSGAFDHIEGPDGMTFGVEGGSFVLTAIDGPSGISMSIRRGINGTVELLSETPLGTVYRVQRSHDLTEWADWSSPIVSDGAEHGIAVPLAPSPSFFRLRIED